jgi:ATP-dependent DNA helicase DinG
MCKITTWLSKTANGELDELDYYGQEFSFIRDINADDAFTFSTDNTYEDREFAIRARRQAKKTNIVIINNNILFQDIDGDNSILSKVENLVIDEAHNLEDVVTKSLQKSFCLQDLE